MLHVLAFPKRQVITDLPVSQCRYENKCTDEFGYTAAPIGVEGAGWSFDSYSRFYGVESDFEMVLVAQSSYKKWPLLMMYMDLSQQAVVFEG